MKKYSLLPLKKKKYITIKTIKSKYEKTIKSEKCKSIFLVSVVFFFSDTLAENFSFFHIAEKGENLLNKN
jgi:hypothetical protein